MVWTRQTIVFNLTKSCPTIGNSAEFFGDFSNSYFIYNMSIIVKISLSIHTIQTYSIENGIDQRKLHHHISYRLDTADD